MKAASRRAGSSPLKRPQVKVRRLLPKSRAVGTGQLADEFIATAKVAQASVTGPSRPATFLYCHGLELLLKSVLICAGIDEKTLRNLGHDLSATLRAVRQHPSAIRPKLTRTDYYLVGWLNRMYSTKDFEYLFTGYRRYPSLDPVQEMVSRLAAHLRPEVDNAVRAAMRSSGEKP